ncbi:hypothetical protein GQ55_9G519400 [Panicum hallii var. hallii]|uniref:Uncharacterized protein n=1 Tax=Panicum hallii var. hallii TaxID=1504633 RepID=A0A2T7CEA0_9POAL|nr:hypothetical protein GQ55_9G519400 [Panicum hallii var. hallii]
MGRSWRHSDTSVGEVAESDCLTRHFAISRLSPFLDLTNSLKKEGGCVFLTQLVMVDEQDTAPRSMGTLLCAALLAFADPFFEEKMKKNQE